MSRDQKILWRHMLVRINKVAWIVLNRKLANMSTISEELGTSIKTVQRDLDLLRDLGHDIYYSHQAKSFYYRTKPLSISDPKKRMPL